MEVDDRRRPQDAVYMVGQLWPRRAQRRATSVEPLPIVRDARGAVARLASFPRSLIDQARAGRRKCSGRPSGGFLCGPKQKKGFTKC